MYCCFAAMLVAPGIGIWRAYFAPYPSDVTGEKSKRLRRGIYLVEVVAWIVIGIVQWWR